MMICYATHNKSYKYADFYMSDKTGGRFDLDAL